MKIFDFLRELELFYPMGAGEEKTEKCIASYAEIIQRETLKTGETYDYEKVIRHLQRTYRYKSFPSLPDILDALPVGIVIEQRFSGREGEVVKRTLNGIEYEFTIVPNHWEKVKTIEQLDNDILRRVS
jgi:hypothetical protein